MESQTLQVRAYASELTKPADGNFETSLLPSQLRNNNIMNTAKSLRTFQRTFHQAFRTSRRTPLVRARQTLAAFQRYPSLSAVRYQSSQSDSPEPAKPLTDREDTPQSAADEIALRKAISPAYQLWFTCKKCLERSGHTISKQAYHFGTCVIECPKCKGRHLISDNLKIFGDANMTMEDIAKQHGEKLRKGRLGAGGDVEFYDDQATETVMEDHRRNTDVENRGKGAGKGAS